MAHKSKARRAKSKRKTASRKKPVKSRSRVRTKKRSVSRSRTMYYEDPKDNVYLAGDQKGSNTVITTRKASKGKSKSRSWNRAKWAKTCQSQGRTPRYKRKGKHGFYSCE